MLSIACAARLDLLTAGNSIAASTALTINTAASGSSHEVFRPGLS